MILIIDIKGHGRFNVDRDFMHRGTRPRLQLEAKGRFKEVQFNSFVDYEKPTYQPGYDLEGKEIEIKVIKEL